MARLAIVTVVLVAFLAVLEVSCFRTIVTTTIEEEAGGMMENQGKGGSQEQRCRQQVQQRYGQLQSCRRYLQPRGSPFELDMYVNQQHQQEQEQQQQRQCCQPLKELGDCSCQAIQQIVEEQVQKCRQGQQGQEGQWGQPGQQGQQGQREQQQQQLQQILQKARDLPRECGLRRQCDIQIPSFYYWEERRKPATLGLSAICMHVIISVIIWINCTWSCVLKAFFPFFLFISARAETFVLSAFRGNKEKFIQRTYTYIYLNHEEKTGEI